MKATFTNGVLSQLFVKYSFRGKLNKLKNNQPAMDRYRNAMNNPISNTGWGKNINKQRSHVLPNILSSTYSLYN